MLCLIYTIVDLHWFYQLTSAAKQKLNVLKPYFVTLVLLRIGWIGWKVADLSGQSEVPLLRRL